MPKLYFFTLNHQPSTLNLPQVTRRDQILRAWIERATPSDHWHSCISYQGKVHRKSSGTRIRKAAKEFSRLHLSTVISPPAIPRASLHHQTEISLP